MRELGVGLLGLGEVGSGVVSILREHGDDFARRLGARLVFRRACVRDRSRERKVPVEADQITTDPSRVIDAPDVDFVVELIGGTDTAFDWTVRALQAGKHVVSANKALLAERGDAIFAAARDNGVTVRFEGAVGGGIPVIRTLREALTSDRVVEIIGIINGTSNYILTRMAEEGVEYREVLAQAQALGYAEADPTLDVSGGDAAHKLAIMVSLAFGTRDCLRHVLVEGIETVTLDDVRYAREMGYRIKPLFIARDRGDAIEARVHPALLPAASMLANVSGVFNAVRIQGNVLGSVLLTGRGAGGGPTGVSVVADLADLARDVLAGAQSRVAQRSMPEGALTERAFVPAQEVRTPVYLRFSVPDRPGVLGSITTALGRHGVSIAAVTQKEPAPSAGAEARGNKTPVPVIILTHEARFGDVQAALREIEADGILIAPTQVLRVEG